MDTESMNKKTQEAFNEGYQFAFNRYNTKWPFPLIQLTNGIEQDWKQSSQCKAIEAEKEKNKVFTHTQWEMCQHGTPFRYACDECDEMDLLKYPKTDGHA